MMKWFKVCVTCVLFILKISALEKDACLMLGFVKETLICSDCSKLEAVLEGGSDIADYIDSCNTCCVEAEKEDDLSYISAVLLVDMNMITRHPHVDTFVKKHASKYSNTLKVQHRWGKSKPEFILKLQNGKQKVIDIHGWKTEHIEQFIRDKVSAVLN